MMKFKKALCIVLSLMMLLSCCGTIFAAADSSENLPVIYVTGMGSKKVYRTDDPEQKSLFFPINTDAFLGKLSNAGEYIKQSIKNLDPRLLHNTLYSWIWDSFGMAVLDTDGVSNKFADQVTVDPLKLDPDYEKGWYNFNYDCRLSPMDLADELYRYVKMVQEASGCQRYDLIGSSYGTSVIMAFVYKYESELENIDSIAFCVPSYGGVDFVGQLFSGDFDLSSKALQGYIDVMVGIEEVDLLLSILRKSGALDEILSEVLDPLIRAALLDVVKDVVHDVFGTFPLMWSFVQPEYIDSALTNIYGENYADPNHEYAGLIGRILDYNENVMAQQDALFAKIKDAGIHMNIIAKYGRPGVPLSEKGHVMSDGLVTVYTATFGATSSMYGETLPADYEQKLYPEYDFLSDDGCIDASTGAFPFNTWYIKGLEHGEKTLPYYTMIRTVVVEDLDVFTSATYPQFLEVSSTVFNPITNDPEIVPLQPVEPEKETNLIQDCINLIVRIIRMIIDKIAELFKKQ